MKTGINKRVLIIIPCYNESANIINLSQSLNNVQVEGYDFHPLFINDSSGDNTLEVLRSNRLNYLNNPVNLGIGGTVQLGFIYAHENNFDFAVQMDGDGQHPPKELSVLITSLDEQTDVVIGSRFINNIGYRSTGMRRLGIRIFLWLNKMLAGIKISDSTSGFRAYNKKALKELVKYYPDEYPEPESIVYLVNKKMRIREVPVEMAERQGGVSSIGTLASVYYMAKVTLNILFLHLRMKNE